MKLTYNGKEIGKVNAALFFKRYNVTEKDIEYYTELMEVDEQQAIDEFVQKYINNPSVKYNNNIQSYMVLAEQGEMKTSDRNIIERNIVTTSLALSSLLLKNVREFIQRVFALKIFSDNGITDAKLKKIILDATLKEFEVLTTGAMANTQANVLKNIRNMQKEIIIFNQNISRREVIQEFFENQVELFKRNLRKTMPGYYKGMEKGQILVSRGFGPDGQSVYYYKVDYYADMSTRTTILNVDRTSVIESVRYKGGNVVEYYLRDKSPTKTGKRREICKQILNTLLFGKPLLALDDETGALLGIMTVNQAKTTGDKAMGPFCHHSVRSVNREIRKKVNGLLKRRRKEAA